MDYGAILVSMVISAMGVTIGAILQSLIEAHLFKLRERRRSQWFSGGESRITRSTVNPTVSNRPDKAVTKEIIGKLGPWGDPEIGHSFDHNGYDGIKIIKIRSSWVIESIEIQYIKGEELIWVHKQGGEEVAWVERECDDEKNTAKIELEDEEYINEVKGFYGRLGGIATINSLTFFTNKTKYGPYGIHKGTTREEIEVEPTPFQVRGGKIVGFHGIGNKFVSSIGFYVSSLA